MVDDIGREARLWGRITARAVESDSTVSAALICETCVAVTGVDGAGLTITGDVTTGYEPFHATDTISSRLEELQFTLGEGPCVEAFTTGGLVLAPDLRAVASRSAWPGFAGEALEAGAGAVFAFPLQVGAIRLGALDLYRVGSGSLDTEQLADAVGFAELVLGVLLDTQGESEGGPPDGAGGSGAGAGSAGRVEVHQATGMVSVQMGVSLTVALVRLRAYAYVHSQAVHEVAGDVLARRLRFVPEDA